MLKSSFAAALFCSCLHLSHIYAADWQINEFDGSADPGRRLPGAMQVGNKIKEQRSSDPENIYRMQIVPDSGWSHWLFEAPAFTMPDIASGSGVTVEARLKAIPYGQNNLRLSIKAPEGNNWIVGLQHENGQQKVTLRRGGDQDLTFLLPDDFYTIRITIDRDSSAGKASVYLNGNPKPVLENWQGFGGEKASAGLGIGGFSNQRESGELEIDYIRINNKKDIAPDPEQEKLAAQNKPTSEVLKLTRASSSPVIDGELSDACYQELPTITLSEFKKGTKASQAVISGKIGFDGKNLFLGFNCKNPVKPGQEEARDRYNSAFDVLELYLDPEAGRENAYQIALNSSNTLFDGFARSTAWDGQIAHKTKITEDGWNAEMSIPLSSLSETPLSPIFGYNLGYWDSNSGTLFSLQKLDRLFYEPEHFAFLILPIEGDTKALFRYLQTPGIAAASCTAQINAAGQALEYKNQINYFAAQVRKLNHTSPKASPEVLVAMVQEATKLNNEIRNLQKNLIQADTTGQRKELLAEKPFVLYPVYSEEKVNSKFLPKKDNLLPAKISAARNEYETWQFAIVNGSDLLSDGKFTFSPLKNGETVLVPENLEIFKVGEVKLKNPSNNNPYSYAGSLVADPLFPYDNTPISIPANSTIGFRVTLKVPDQTLPGIYRGQANFTANGVTETLPVELKVFDFSLPATPFLKTSFGLWDKKGIDVYHQAPKGTEKHFKLYELYTKTLLQYRLTPRVFPLNFDPEKLDEYEKWQRAQLNAGATTILVPFSSPPAAYVKDIEAILKKNGWSGLAYTRSGDEPSPPQFKKLLESTEKWKDAVSVPNLIAGNEGFNQLGSIVDWWCPLSNVYNPEWAMEQRKAGKQVWWYTCNVPLWPFANPTLLDHSGIENKVLFWQSYDRKVDGLLNWNTVNWRYGNPFEVTEGWPGSNGDGYLFYPGENGPLPSLRLELCRDGMEEYDYLAILEKLLEKKRTSLSKETIEKVEKALDLSNLCSDLKNYSREINDYKTRRNEIAGLIEELQK